MERFLRRRACVVHAPPLHRGSDGLCVVLSIVLILPVPSLMCLSIFCRFCDVFFGVIFCVDLGSSFTFSLFDVFMYFLQIL